MRLGIERIKTIMWTILGVLLFLLVLLIGFYFWASSSTLSEAHYSRLAERWTDILKNNQPQKSSQEFLLMTYNIGYLSGITNNLPVVRQRLLFEENARQVLAYLQKNPPDIIALQEIDYASRRSFDIDQLQTIMVGAAHPYGARAINWDKRYVPFPYWPPRVHFGRILSGQAVTSRFPIASTQRHVLPKPKDNPFYYNAFYTDRLVQIVQIRVQGRTLMVFNCHLEAFDQETRQLQARKVLELVRSYKNRYPVIVAGDFNAPPAHAVQKKGFIDEPEADYSTDLTMALFFAEPGLKAACYPAPLLTFPANQPTRQLDYIFYNEDHITCLGAEVVGLTSSDHLPLIMRFAFVTGPSGPPHP